MYLYWINDRFIFIEIFRLLVVGILFYINGIYYYYSLFVVDYYLFFKFFFLDEEKDVVLVDGIEVYVKSYEEDLIKEGGNGLMLSCVCSFKIYYKFFYKDI